MFDNFKLLFSWILASISQIWTVCLNNWGVFGVCIIGFPVLRKIVSIFKKIL